MALALLSLGIPGCGLPPCFEGELQIELTELNEQWSYCSFEGLPGGTALLVKSSGNRGNLGDACRRQYAVYVETPEGEFGRAVSNSSDKEPANGREFGVLEKFEFEERGCQVTVSASLYFDRKYSDFESAMKGQRSGDTRAFHFRHDYFSETAGCEMLMTESMEEAPVLSCGNVHFAHVTEK